MTLEPELVARVDRAARRIGMSRSGFTRRALQDALDRLHERELEKRQRAGYRRKPVRRGELNWPAREQVWPD
jgi:metal-responsive CopG/Arc/MetJ family transcriptional regulator